MACTNQKGYDNIYRIMCKKNVAFIVARVHAISHKKRLQKPEEERELGADQNRTNGKKVN